MLIEKTHTGCPQEEHDSCACVLPKVMEKDGMFVYTPYIFEVTEQVLVEFGGEA
jgi:hypothetical protein